MESLINKPIYKYTKSKSSIVNFKNWKNCCFISSFQIQMNELYSDFPNLNDILILLYENTSNAYTHFAYDFPEKWFILKNHLISKNSKWSDILDKIVLRICIPTCVVNECVLISYIDMNLIIPEEIKNGNNDSLERALSDKIPDNKITINIIQQHNHFEPINIISQIGELKDLQAVSDYETFFS